MEETAQLVPPRNPGEATLHSPPQTPLSLFAPSGLRITPAAGNVWRWIDLRYTIVRSSKLSRERLCTRPLV
ncbi:MAG: hypothetical protein HYW48_02275 [Deltaproteobacteria bacterium]|nr:hypothetical protein [Deltaproteobacteria bacterium]